MTNESTENKVAEEVSAEDIIAEAEAQVEEQLRSRTRSDHPRAREN